MKTKENFLQDPLVEFYRLGEYPQEWLSLALFNKDFREVIFENVVKDVSKGHRISEDEFSQALACMPIDFRQELFSLCCRCRIVSDWYDDFVNSIGPVDPNFASNTILPLFESKWYRKSAFGAIAVNVRNGKSFRSVGWGTVLAKLPQNFRDELFLFCCRFRLVLEWSNDFFASIGPVTPSVTSKLRLPLLGGNIYGYECNLEDDSPFKSDHSFNGEEAVESECSPEKNISFFEDNSNSDIDFWSKNEDDNDPS